MSFVVANSEVEIIERAIDESRGGWSPEIARAILPIKLSSADVTRMNELAAKARSGTLDHDEELQIEAYRSAARVLEILKLRARAALQQQPESPAN